MRESWPSVAGMYEYRRILDRQGTKVSAVEFGLMVGGVEMKIGTWFDISGVWRRCASSCIRVPRQQIPANGTIPLNCIEARYKRELIQLLQSLPLAIWSLSSN